ncbi:MAG: class I SAM-dependent methyltransferase [Verrucomicrobiae bacterium]|nr:class I SAM-dependent methyltransferase [Verrucomicrobiae bacterium]
MDILAYNRKAWNKQAREGSRWSEPAGPEIIAAAKEGHWSVILTPNKSVPAEWFGDISGKNLLCLASGGGQQAPILAAAGANVVSFDNSDEQLARDKQVADRDGLTIKTIRGDMADLSALSDASIDLIFHPVSNCFAENIQPVWQECYRVLRPRGRLLTGFTNPSLFLFEEDDPSLQVKFPLPYSDVQHRSKEALETQLKNQEPLGFGHTLEQQIGGQLKGGFVLIDLYEDTWNEEATPLNKYTSTFISTLAQKR